MPTIFSDKLEPYIELVWEDMFNGELFVIDDDLDAFKIPLDYMPKSMNNALKIYHLPYWKELYNNIFIGSNAHIQECVTLFW